MDGNDSRGKGQSPFDDFETQVQSDELGDIEEESFDIDSDEIERRSDDYRYEDPDFDEVNDDFEEDDARNNHGQDEMEEYLATERSESVVREIDIVKREDEV